MTVAVDAPVLVLARLACGVTLLPSLACRNDAPPPFTGTAPDTSARLGAYDADVPSDLSITFQPDVSGHIGWAKLPAPVPLHMIGDLGAVVVYADADSPLAPRTPLGAELFAIHLANANLPDTSLVVDEHSLCSPQLLAATEKARPPRLLLSLEDGLSARGAGCLAALPSARLYLTGCLYRRHRADDACDGDAELEALVSHAALRARVRGLALSLRRAASVSALANFPGLEVLALVSGRDAEPAHFDALPSAALSRLRYLDVTQWLDGDAFVSPAALRLIGRLHTLRWNGGSFFGDALSECALRRLWSGNLRDDEVRALARCTQLTEVSSDNASFSSVEPVARWPGLERLHLRHFAPLDLAPLGALNKLRLLSLGGSSARDFGFVAQLGELREVDLSQTPLADLRVFATLARLERLDVGFTTVRDLGPLRDLTTLVELDLHATQVQDLTPLAQLRALRTLNVSQSPIRDLTPLTRHPALAWVILYDTGVTDAAALLTLPQLKHAHIGGLTLPPAQVAALKERLGYELDGAR